MQRACLFAALLTILLPLGCNKKDAGLSGTYKGRTGSVTFQDDGNFESTSHADVVKGTYKLEGRKLSMTVTEVNGKPPQYISGLATATLSDDGKSISGEGDQLTRQE